MIEEGNIGRIFESDASNLPAVDSELDLDGLTFFLASSMFISTALPEWTRWKLALTI